MHEILTLVLTSVITFLTYEANVAKRVRHDEKKHFSTWKYPWKLPKK